MPVYVSVEHKPEVEVLAYAMLDSMSNGSYVTSTLLNQLDSRDHSDANLKLSTMTTVNADLATDEYYDLRVRGFYSKDRHPIFQAYARESAIPHNRNHIPTNEIAARWSHLREITKHMPPLLDCPVSLLLGYDNNHLSAVKQSIYVDSYDAPNAVECRLGWAITGNTWPVAQDNSFGFSHDDSTSQAQHNLKVRKYVSAFCQQTMSVNDEITSDTVKPIDSGSESSQNSQVSGAPVQCQDQFESENLNKSLSSLDDFATSVLSKFQLEPVTLPLEIKKLLEMFGTNNGDNNIFSDIVRCITRIQKKPIRSIRNILLAYLDSQGGHL